METFFEKAKRVAGRMTENIVVGVAIGIILSIVCAGGGATEDE